jgi:hypothetical protein
MVSPNVRLAKLYYEVYGTTQAFIRTNAVENRDLIRDYAPCVSCYFINHGNLEGTDLKIDRRAKGILTLILSEGVEKVKGTLKGKSIGECDRLLEETLKKNCLKKENEEIKGSPVVHFDDEEHDRLWRH